MPDTNPLLQAWDLPPWSTVRAEHLVPGTHLPSTQQQQLARLNLQISLLEDLFLSHLENATAAWSKRIDDVTQLNGLSQATKDRLALNAQQAGHEGWLIRLGQDTYNRVMTYAENRDSDAFASLHPFRHF
ncbi:hypothetical protein ACYZTX_01995 [Pseudomonas sp. MDT1-17]